MLVYLEEQVGIHRCDIDAGPEAGENVILRLDAAGDDFRIETEVVSNDNGVIDEDIAFVRYGIEPALDDTHKGGARLHGQKALSR